MNENSRKPEIGGLIADLEVLQEFLDNFKSTLNNSDPESQAEQLYQLAISVSGINVSEIIASIIGLSQSDSSSSDQSSRVSQQLDQLKTELETKELKIQEFKFSLADTVIESKNLQKKNAELTETINRLHGEITQMQLHTKDQGMKLSNIEKNYKISQNELSQTSEELRQFRDQSYSLKARCADLEDQLRELDQRVNQLTGEGAAKSQEIDRLKKLTDRLNASFELIRTEKNTLEERSSELEATIDVLQKEKNRLQQRLDNLLVGMPKAVSYSAPDESSIDRSLLEPVSFSPYIPFCFPDRIPEVIGLKKNIRHSFAKTFPKENPPPAQLFPHNFTLRIEQIQARFFAFKPSFNCSIASEFYHLFPPLVPVETPEHNLVDFRPIEAANYQPAEDTRLFFPALKKPQKLLQRSQSVNATHRIKMKAWPAFGIHTYSLDLLLSFLSRTIIEGNYRDLRHPGPLVIPEATILNRSYIMKSAKFFNEKLAFRYGYQLKSHRLNLHRAEFMPSFKRGSGLRSVLETFGNTISLMVQKFDFFSSRPNEKNGKNNS